MKNLIFTVFFLVSFVSLSAQIIYVTPEGAGLKDGTSWGNALDGNSPAGNGYTKLAQLTQTAPSGRQFWIGAGSYYAATDNNRGRFFLLKDGVSFYGGFSGIENTIDERHIQQNRTILSGDIGISNDFTDNSVHIFATDQYSTAFVQIPVIDGFTLFGGNANISSGAFNNTGGAVYIWSGKDVIIRNSVITNNNGLRGGAIYTLNKATISNCVLSNNGQSAVDGGEYTVFNSTIVNNEKTFIFRLNSFDDNCIVWNNGAPGGTYGGVNEDPLFINPSSGIGFNFDGLSADWNLLPASPCIDAGINTGIPYNTFYDCANRKRINNGTVDLGAMEYNSSYYTTFISRNPCSAATIASLTDTTAEIEWIRGNGIKTKVWVARADQSNNLPKTNGSDFIADSLFRAGGFVMENGMAWFCTYNATENSVALSGLCPGTNYAVCIFEHFGDSLAQLPETISFTTPGTASTVGQIFYVKNGGGINGHDGRTWETAFSAPNLALSLAKSSDYVWMAGGTYFPTPANNRYEPFLLKNGIKILGGFAGNEMTLSQRIPGANETILSGNIGNPADSLDNSYHVIYSLPSATLWSDTALLDNITILDGVANGSGENNCGGGVFLNTNCVLKMTFCNVHRNSCIGSGNPNSPVYTGGGGIMNKGKLMMEDCEVSKNKAVYLGGGLFNNGELSLKNCLIESNRITFPGGGWFDQWGGGGIYNFTTGKMTVNSCEIKNNTTQNNLHAGGIYNKGKLQLQRSTIESNFSGRDGGGIYSMGTTIIEHCHFTTNQSAYYGGAIVATDTLKIDSCLFDYNKGGSQPNIVTSGVSIISNSELSHSIVTNQSGRAGGIYSNGKTKVINCNIHSNDTHGIQMINTGGMFNFVIIFTGSDGGGIQHQGDTLWVENCNIHHNIAGGGGGIAVYSGVAYIKNSKLVNNFTAVGAAIRNKAKVYVSNSLFANNWYYNGGLFQNVSNSYMEIESSTISNNRQISTSNGNALLYHGEFQNLLANQFQLNNCIIETQSALTGYYPGASGSDFISYSAVTGGFPGAGNINSNPLFVNPTADTDTSSNALQADWTLSACSPCVNAGNDAFVNDSLDLGGNIRKFNQVDMGAYELQYLNIIASVNASQIGRTKALIAWETSILPCRTAVFVKDTIAGQPPIDNVGLYSANTLLGSGSQLDGWSCIFNGTGDSVAISGLSEGITYRIAVFNFVLNQFYDLPVLQNFTTEKTEIAAITKTYGDSPFTVQASSASGITAHFYSINYDSIAAVNNNIVTVSGAGTAVIKAFHIGNTYYLPDSTETNLTVTKAILNAVSDDKVKTYGEINPPLTVSYTGFAGADDESVIDTLVYALTDATSNSNAGTYIIYTLGGFDNNYSFNRINGVLTINKLIRQISSTTSICEGDTLAVGNHFYTTSGVYLDTIVSTNIDTIFTTYLTVNPVYAFTENHSICNGETYTWQGTDYTSAGIYTANYSSVSGCDSIFTLNLTVNPVYAFTENHSICSGGTYTWQGADYTYAGNYTANYSSVSGCDSIFTLNLTVNPVYAFTENHSICNGGTYTWQGTDYTSAGVYTANYLSVSGCDSIYTLNLTVNPVYAFTENHSICSGGTYTWQATDYTSAGIYTANYSSVSGCDSIFTLNLIVNPVYAFTENHSICNGGTYTWQGSDYTSAGIYTANYSSVNGCDSIYTLNLTVNPVYAFTENYSICNGETYTWQGTDYTSAGVYNANYSTVNGCDSIFTLNLTVNPVYAFTENHSICNGETYTWQGTDYTSAGIYNANYASVSGCDSIFTLNLTVNPVYAFTENHSICNGETYSWQGTDYTSAGVYTANYSSINGCDSMYTLNLNVNIIDITVTLSGITLTANTLADAYQWIDCGNGFALINGEVSQSFTASFNGSYAVIITEGMCSDTSLCTEVTTVGTQTFDLQETIRIYPNPTADELNIEWAGNTKIINFRIFNATGEVVLTGSLLGKTVVNTRNLAPGLYLIQPEKGKSISFIKTVDE